MTTNIKNILERIKRKAELIKRPVVFMELCGTHAESVAENSIRNLLPKNISLISGPGCPICVTDQEDVDIVTGLAKRGIPIAVYGDATGVPGSEMSLEEARQKGAKIYIVYSVEEALEIQKKEPNLIFWGIGFETTAPASAWAVKNGLPVFSSHKTFLPAMGALLENKKIGIDGFINPGHVSAIIGVRAYEQFKFPQVIAGFEALDVLLAIDMLLSQLLEKKKGVENEYKRLVKENGNKKAQKLIENVFEIRDSSWRGLGEIKRSGLKIRKKYQKWDVEKIYQKEIGEIKKKINKKKTACRCGEVLQGLIKPKECPLFKRICFPDNPQGACMVSREGSCNIEYRYGK